MSPIQTSSLPVKAQVTAMTKPKLVGLPCDPDTFADCPECGQTYHSNHKQSRRCVNRHFPGSSTRCGQCQRRRGKGEKKPATTPSDGGPHAPTDPAIVLQEWEHFGEFLGYPPSRFARRLGRTPDHIRRLLAAHAERRPNDPRPSSFEAAWEREFRASA